MLTRVTGEKSENKISVALHFKFDTTLIFLKNTGERKQKTHLLRQTFLSLYCLITEYHGRVKTSTCLGLVACAHMILGLTLDDES